MAMRAPLSSAARQQVCSTRRARSLRRPDETGAGRRRRRAAYRCSLIALDQAAPALLKREEASGKSCWRGRQESFGLRRRGVQAALQQHNSATGSVVLTSAPVARPDPGLDLAPGLIGVTPEEEDVCTLDWRYVDFQRGRLFPTCGLANASGTCFALRACCYRRRRSQCSSMRRPNATLALEATARRALAMLRVTACAPVSESSDFKARTSCACASS